MIKPKILIIGATGFVGKNLVESFTEQSISVRVLTRNPKKISSNSDFIEIVKGDLGKRETLEKLCSGIEVVYYLSHSMAENSDFETLEKQHADNLISCLDSKVKLIYLSGIIPNTPLSKHLRSRKQVGDIFRASLEQVIEFRASIIIGQGSTSFEMVKALTQRVPFILNASWTNSFCQPISIQNVIRYLNNSHLLDFGRSRIFDIGGEDVLKYKDLLVEYANFMNLKRPELNIQDFPKPLASKILTFLIPEYAKVGGKLVESIEHETILTDSKAAKFFNIKPMKLNTMFNLNTETEVEQIDLKPFFEFLSTNESIPDYLKGQKLTYRVNLADSINISNIMDRLEKIPLINIKKDQRDFFIKIPYTAQAKLCIGADEKTLILIIDAKYFFQKAGFSIITAIIQKISKQN